MRKSHANKTIPKLRNIVLLLCLPLIGWSQNKINGICTVAPSFEIKQTNFESVVALHANWIAVIPYAFCNPTSATVTYDHPRQWWGEKPEGIRKTIQLAHDNHIKVLLKPHLWVKSQGWAGDLIFERDADLKVWQSSYRDYLLTYTAIAAEMNVEMISIGTELKKLAVKNPDYWTDLICDVKNIYHGTLTYSANWDNYQNIPFWNQLDYIGIDAYFPVHETATPTAADIQKSYSKLVQQLGDFSKKQNRKILFTEFGFRSIDHCANGHWISDDDQSSSNVLCQKNAYDAFFKTFWNQPWLAGGFVWKWFFNHQESGGHQDDQFTPQNKPAEISIRNQFVETSP